MGQKRISSTFRLSETAARLLVLLAFHSGTSKTTVLETLIRREARKQGIQDGPVPDKGGQSP
jgi:hypothetical protein